MVKNLRGGFTTGAAAAAGVKAALIYFTSGEIVDFVEITALDGTLLNIPINRVEKISDTVKVEVIKDSGDDPDITNGVSIFTTTKITGNEIIFRAGAGVGKITKRGLQLPIGEPAINPGPRQLIKNVAQEFNIAGLEVEISIPAGVELAKKTLNPILGVEGGLSIIGTTGVLRPMSEDAFKNSLVPQIDVAKAAGFETLIFVPGKIGETIAKKIGFEAAAIIQTSNFIGFMLDAAAERQIAKIILCGHIGKLIKVAAGIFHTHNRIADARLETLAAYAAAEGLSAVEVQKILAANTTEDATQIISANHLEIVYEKIAARASFRAERYVFGKMKVSTILVDYAGNILGTDFDWKIKRTRRRKIHNTSRVGENSGGEIFIRRAARAGSIRHESRNLRDNRRFRRGNKFYSRKNFNRRSCCNGERRPRILFAAGFAKKKILAVNHRSDTVNQRHAISLRKIGSTVALGNFVKFPRAATG